MTKSGHLRRFDVRRVLFCVFGVALVGTLGVLIANHLEGTSAADLGQFRAGNIMSDEVMGDYTSMSEAEISSFMHSKNSCNDTDLSKESWYPNLQHHIENGHFVCLADEWFDGESSVHIIWQAAQDYRINPQVLLVLLEKEQGLITDTWPDTGQYRGATGYGCPDTAACDSQYYGFKNQVRNAASLFREVLDGGWSNYPAYTTQYVKYNPDAGCGGTNVYIENRATSALYRYTPYQPNAGALAAGYGGKVTCGAYGNRNFYAYFTDWFGDTHNLTRSAGTDTGIAEGTYYIASKENTGQLLDIVNGSLERGANVQIFERNNSDAQKWTIRNAGDGYYYIANAVSGKVIDLDNALTDDGNNIKMWDSNGSCAQKWKPISTPDGAITFASACFEGKVLDLAGGDVNNGSNIQIWRANNTDAQKWVLLPENTIQEGTYEVLSNLDEAKTMDISGGRINNNDANIQIWQRNDTNAQKWVIASTGDGYYTIANPNSGKRVDLKDAAANSGQNIHLWEANNTCAQKWGVATLDESHITFFSACGGGDKVIDISGGNSGNGANIQLWSANNSNAQKWLLFSGSNAVEDGTYEIMSNLDETKAMDISGGRINDNDANIQLWQRNGTNAQKWVIASTGDGYYTIANPNSGSRLDLSGGVANWGQNIHLWEANGTCAQKWKVLANRDSSVSLLSACNDSMAIDVAGGSNGNGSNIQLWGYNSTAAQRWKLAR